MKRPKQLVLSPEMAPPSFPEIDEAARNYLDFRDSRMAALKEEVKAHDALLNLLREQGVFEYEFDGFQVTVGSKQKVSVRRKKEEKDGDDDGD